MTQPELSAREARRVHLIAQGLLGPRLKGAEEVVPRTRGVQLDTISVLARSHELIAYARLGAVPRKLVEECYWGGPPYRNIEFWYHAACVLPIEEWPNLAWKREERRLREFRWHRLVDAKRVCAQVLSELRARGPLTAKELGGAKRGGPWWDWSDTKIAVEWLLDIGEVVCTTRRGFQRVYDLPERAIPAELLGAEVPRREGVRILTERAGTALGVATVRDIAAYAGLKRGEVLACLGSTALDPVRVEGWSEQAYATSASLQHPAVTGTSRARSVLLSPFDGVVCDRPRLERHFGFRHRLEAYVPQARRIHGYYAMPVLAGDRFVGRVDPARDGSTLVARSVHLEDLSDAALRRAARSTAASLLEAAKWVGCDSVAIERVEPPTVRNTLLDALDV
ncbi:MAG: winged helix-turn-helix domain-containing protein [Acidimicrobiales bacterium]